MLLIFIQILTVLVPVAVSTPNVYDQRQSGNSNVRIDVRDAVFIAIADEFGDYDYTYDYSDLTIKPETSSSATAEPTTAQSVKPVALSSPSGVPSESSSPIPKPSTTEESIPGQNTSIIIDNSTLTFVTKPGNETEVAVTSSRPPPPSPFNTQDYQIPVIVLHDVKENMKLLPVKIVEKSATAVKVNLTEGLPQPRHCSPGFFLDSYNRCKRIRKPLRENVQLKKTPDTGS